MSVRCSCCSQERTEYQVGALQCHPQTRVCRECINWLQHQAGMVETTPTFPVVDMGATIAFYEAIGFDVHAYDDGFAFVRYEDVSVFDLDLRVDLDVSRNMAGCFLIVADSDAWRERVVAVGVPVGPIENVPWGMREFAFADPNGNRIRVGTSVST